MAKLYRAVYCSRCLIDDGERAIQAEIDRILAVSAKNNARNDLSGALMFSFGYFVQVLEGALNDVETTLARIELDPRHDQFRLLELGPVRERAFTKWGMLFAGARIGNDPRTRQAVERAISAGSEGGEELLSFLLQAV
jgi:hypothetical protein